MTNEEIGYFWQVLHLDNISPLRVEYSTLNLISNEFSPIKVLPFSATSTILGDYSVSIASNNTIIYD